MKKRLFLLVTVLCLIFSNIALAAEANKTINGEEQQIEPRYIPCPNGGKHQMKSFKAGIAKDDNAGMSLNTARFYKCSGCGLYLATENIVFSNQVPGHVFASNSVSYVGDVCWMTGDCYIGYYRSLTQDDWIKGFEFNTFRSSEIEVD